MDWCCKELFLGFGIHDVLNIVGKVLLSRLANLDRFQWLSLFADCLIFFYLLLVTIYPMVMSDTYKLRLVSLIIMDRWIIGIKDLILL